MAESKTGQFRKVAKTKDLPPAGGLIVQVDGVDVALFNEGGTLRAIDNTCLHMGGPLGEGSLEGCVVTCPWHGWEYDVRTGECKNRPGLKVRTHPVKVEGEDVLVALA